MSKVWRVTCIPVGDVMTTEDTFLEEAEARSCVSSIQRQGRPVSLYCNESLGDVGSVWEIPCGLSSDQGWYRVSI